MKELTLKEALDNFKKESHKIIKEEVTPKKYQNVVILKNKQFDYFK